MRARAGLLGLLVLVGVLLVTVSPAQDEESPRPLPRVMLIGDTTFRNHHQGAAKALAGRAEVVLSPLGHLDSGAALERLDEVLQRKEWDLVCVNFGLSDLMCRDPRTRAIRAMSPAAGGVPVTGAEQYASNLDALVARLRASGAKLLWTTTLPLSPRNRNGALDPGTVARYHAVATDRMRGLDVPLLDTRAQIAEELAQARSPREADRLHNEILKRDLSPPLVTRILELAGE